MANLPQGASLAHVLMSVFTPRQRRLIFDQWAQSGHTFDDVVDELQQSNVFDAPLLSYADMPEVYDAEDIMYLFAANTVFNGDEFAAPSDTDSVKTALMRSLKMSAGRAEEMAEEVVTEDSEAAAYSLKLLRVLPDLAGIESAVVRAAIGGLIMNAGAVLADVLGNRVNNLDPLYEWLRLGRALYENKKRRGSEIAGYAYLTALRGAGAETGDPFASEQGDALSALPAAVNALLGTEYFKTDQVIDDHDAAADVVNSAADAIEQSGPSPYAAAVARSGGAEQGGLFGSIGKFLSGAARTVAPALAKLAPAVGSGIGGVFGGPIGTLAGGAAGQALGSAISPKRGRGRGRGMVAQAVHASRSRPPRLVNRSSSNGVIDDVLRVLRSHGYYA